MKIEIGDGTSANTAVLIIDGEAIDKHAGYLYGKVQISHSGDGNWREDGNIFDIIVHDKNLSTKISSLKPKDFPGKIIGIKFYDLFHWFTGSHFVEVIWETGDDGRMYFACDPDFTLWKFPYSFTDYHYEFKKRLSSYSRGMRVEDMDFEAPALTIVTDFDFDNRNIAAVISFYLGILNEIHREVLDFLKNKNIPLLVTTFDFPEKISSSCEQYLLYFVQFPRDSGINATSELKEEAGKVLFSITPENNIDALNKIREALAFYLHLPSSPIIYDDSFAAMRLQQQIANLQHSQTMAAREILLAQKVIESQDKIIDEKNSIVEQKDSLIEQQRKVIEKITNPSVIIDSAEEKDEFVEICEGLSVGESEFLKKHLGIKFNPAKLLGAVGNQLTGREDTPKSVLGLEEENKDIEQ